MLVLLLLVMFNKQRQCLRPSKCKIGNVTRSPASSSAAALERMRSVASDHRGRSYGGFKLRESGSPKFSVPPNGETVRQTPKSFRGARTCSRSSITMPSLVGLRSGHIMVSRIKTQSDDKSEYCYSQCRDFSISACEYYSVLCQSVRAMLVNAERRYMCNIKF